MFIVKKKKSIYVFLLLFCGAPLSQDASCPTSSRPSDSVAEYFSLSSRHPCSCHLPVIQCLHNQLILKGKIINKHWLASALHKEQPRNQGWVFQKHHSIQAVERCELRWTQSANQCFRSPTQHLFCICVAMAAAAFFLDAVQQKIATQSSSPLNSWLPGAASDSI